MAAARAAAADDVVDTWAPHATDAAAAADKAAEFKRIFGDSTARKTSVSLATNATTCRGSDISIKINSFSIARFPTSLARPTARRVVLVAFVARADVATTGDATTAGLAVCGTSAGDGNIGGGRSGPLLSSDEFAESCTAIDEAGMLLAVDSVGDGGGDIDEVSEMLFDCQSVGTDNEGDGATLTDGASRMYHLLSTASMDI